MQSLVSATSKSCSKRFISFQPNLLVMSSPFSLTLGERSELKKYETLKLMSGDEIRPHDQIFPMGQSGDKVVALLPVTGSSLQNSSIIWKYSKCCMWILQKDPHWMKAIALPDVQIRHT